MFICGEFDLKPRRKSEMLDTDIIYHGNQRFDGREIGELFAEVMFK